MTSVIAELCEGVLEITLNRPDRLNAFTAEMHERLREALDRAEEDDAVRALLITGAGRGFCAGQDLAERDPRAMMEAGTWPPDAGAGLRANYNPLILRLKGLPKPVVTAVNGVAAGAGANFAFAGDIVLAARSARFIQAFVKIGLAPDAGGTWFLPRYLGEARAKALAMTGDPLSAEQAADWGLIWACHDDAALMDESRGLARRLAAGATHAIGLMKGAIQAAASNDLAAQLELEAATQTLAGAHPDYGEGVMSFLEKRAPRFGGDG
ncbi:MAG: 2-(1,2-epoxy-1,2-dihydrophenyl)acetyl-CoA isomerase PaaG [Pseudomonadota bacterium]